MTLVPVDEKNFEKFTIIAHPLRKFHSSSMGVTGSVKLFPAGSKNEKDSGIVFSEDIFQDDSRLEDILTIANDIGIASGSNLAQIEQYLLEAGSRGQTRKNETELLVRRFKPGSDISRDYLSKNVIRKHLMRYYVAEMTNPNWSFTNYNCLNFFTSSETPNNAALAFPSELIGNFTSSMPGITEVRTSHVPTGSFSFDFWIKPEYTNDEGEEFEAGCIMHVSSSYAISLVSGSKQNSKGQAESFRIQLQLGDATDISPKTAYDPSVLTRAAYQSDEIPINKWSHVAISWGSNEKNDSTGSFYINSIPSGDFVYPSASISPKVNLSNASQPLVLSIGNWWEGPGDGTSSQNILFDADIGEREGLKVVASAFSQDGIPENGDYSAPLNAKICELKIYDAWRGEEEISSSMGSGASLEKDLIFYLPPFFTKESPERTFHNLDGGILQTPFFSSDGVTDDPYNTSMAFGVGGFYPNIENWGRDFASDVYGRWVNMSASLSSVVSATKTADEYLEDFIGHKMRRNIIFPNDNGDFVPNYSLLLSGTYTLTPGENHEMSKFVDDFGNLDLSQINISRFINEDNLLTAVAHGNNSPLKDLEGATPEEPGIAPGKTLTIFERTRDSSSNQIIMFDINSLYYGSRIKPGSFKVTDPKLKNSGGKLSCTICDDENGGLYVESTNGSSEKRSVVGNIFYNEGLVVIYHPTLRDFGHDEYEMEFRGEQRIQVMKISVDAPSGQINSSSHINYLNVPYNNNVNEPEQKFVYISDIAFLDKDLNVLMKTHLAQPVKKRSSDDFQFKTKIDL